tara:strand:+ start:2633 stop:3823 length:1191 start_codon:yes stop_codon:yes gene_type:complete
MCVLSIFAAWIAYLAGFWFEDIPFPEVSGESLKMLLGVLTSGMLVIATFAAGAMISAYASASQTATPRAFPIIVSDDVSQNALSTFVGAFLFSVVALLALLNEAYTPSGRFFLLILTLCVFWTVVLTFIRWVDRIARLGRLGMTLEKVEQTVTRSIKHYHKSWLWNQPAELPDQTSGRKVTHEKIGYLQRVNWDALQSIAEEAEIEIQIQVTPGTFVTPERTIALLQAEDEELPEETIERIQNAFRIGSQRVFDEDPRFGFIVLSEIASRALSPAVNDPGTAIQIIGQFVRLLHLWKNPKATFDPENQTSYGRLSAPRISIESLLDDSFLGISRNGASFKEVMVRLQKAYRSLEAIDPDAAVQIQTLSEQSLQRAKSAIELKDDFEAVQDAASPKE